MSSYLRPRRGKKSTAIAQLTSSNPLKRGEIFFEVPDEGVGTGAGKIKMGDGVTAYADLPYFSDVEEVGTELTQAQYNALTPEQKANGTYWITDASGGNVVIDTALDATSNNAIANKPVAEAITQLNNDLAIHYNTKITINNGDYNGNVYIPNYISTWGGKFLLHAVPSASSVTIGANTYKVFVCSLTNNSFKVILVNNSNNTVVPYSPNYSSELTFNLYYNKAKYINDNP